jgi:alpha-glucosidase (family GH31 glycosyl hydrolase)
MLRSLSFCLPLCILCVLIASAGAQEVLESGNIRLEVATGGSYSYKVIDTSTGAALVDQSATDFDGNAVAGTGAASMGSNWLEVPLTISGGQSGLARFEFTAPGILEVNLSGVGGYTPGSIGEQFVDQGENYYGVWEQASPGYPRAAAYGSVPTLTNNGRVAMFDGEDDLDLIDNPDGMDGKVFAASARAPFYMTDTNVGVYAETLARGAYSFGDAGSTSMSFETPALKYHLFAGSTRKDVLKKYNSVNGGCYVPPDWSYDSFWWRDNPASAAEAIADAQMLQDLQIHASTYWLDRPYSSDPWGCNNMDLDPTKYPDPDAFAQEMQDNYGLNLLVFIANRADVQSDFYAEAEALGYLFDGGDGITVTDQPAVDIRNPEAYAWFKSQLNDLLHAATDAEGNSLIKGYKIDRGGEGGIPMELVNELVPMFSQLTNETLQSVHGDDYFSFSRSLNDKSRLYTAHWNGDPRPTMESFKLTVAESIRCGLMNFSVWGSDIGSYDSDPPGSPPSAELQQRWTAFGAYVPMMEFNMENRGWWFNTDPESLQVQATTTKFAREHHMLIPYVRSLVADSNRSGIPAIRAMFLEFEDDPNCADAWDQYMYGPNLLVAPVTDAGVTSRSVYLPQGMWVDYNDKSTVYDASAGGMDITADAPIDIIPLFVRAGGIVTRGDIVKGNNNWDPDWSPELLIEVFAFEGIESAFDYWNGEEFTTIIAGLDNGEMSLTFGDLGDPGAFEIYLMDGTLDSLLVNGTALTEGVDYTLHDGIALFQVPEPASLSLLGLGGLVLLRRRRN